MVVDVGDSPGWGYSRSDVDFAIHTVVDPASSAGYDLYLRGTSGAKATTVLGKASGFVKHCDYWFMVNMVIHGKVPWWILMRVHWSTYRCVAESIVLPRFIDSSGA